MPVHGSMSAPSAGHHKCIAPWHAHRRSRAPHPGSAAVAYKQAQAALWDAAGAATQHAQTELLRPLYDQAVDVVKHYNGGIHDAGVLDIASGPGEPAVSLAKALPTCSVLATDAACSMVHLAQSRANNAGLSNMRASVEDAENLHTLPSGTFAAVTCCAGLMFCPDHHRALREWRRVLVPQGLVVIAVTGRPDQMQVSDLVGPMLSALQPEHNAVYTANPRGFGSVRRLLQDIERAGFCDVCARTFNVPMRIAPGGTAAYCAANPVLAEALQRMSTKEAAQVVQVAEQRLLAAACQWQYVQADGSIRLDTNVYTVITATAA